MVFLFFKFYWGIIVLQWCVSFYCTAKWGRVSCAIQQVLISYLFIHITVYMPIPISQFIPPFPTLVSIHLFSKSVSLFLPCKPVHLYHFSRFHIYASIHDIWFALSDLLHSGPSTCLQMTQFCSFLWWVIFHCIYVPHLHYSFICRWTFRLLPWPGYCK